MTLEQTLAQKPLYSERIDITRMPRAYDFLKEALHVPSVVHIVGTNGKGSTGRFLALMLKQQGKKVGHYTSPHLMRFNERIWRDGKLVEDEELEALHVKLSLLLPPDMAHELSYFEYTTFLAMLAFASCEVAVLEAGLGGEWDATNVFPKTLSIITPIGMDHQAFLGETLEEIASTKLRSMSAMTVIAPKQDVRVLKIAKTLAKEKEIPLVFPEDMVSLKTETEMKAYLKAHTLPEFFTDNLKSAYACARLMGVFPEISLLPPLDLRARYEKIAPNIVLDCGHNPMAASALLGALENSHYIFIYNSYLDKDIAAILEILKPKIKELWLMPLSQKGRQTGEALVVEASKQLNIPFGAFRWDFDPQEKYVVFGSFAVVERFLEEMNA
ncbi:bifunctional folylpolyglutamate synthase/dihydrofolate synthase [Sulfurospirillum sp. T05]|uniref:Bifunctional folylpolyglutamate synthase/dihydrofolate synthase n=1 Tax=Sulfurospirillum tamanense TaxID=2813362 RepID=A0ABS2WQK8_9BACT|nr:Mur ligase family protein [Sulfurospirillum tamanensis]MBN2963898.1 bifunctional folylpolyglutamate synthase/dihydrofolate synthase [Sulfurospirillum tamanensis]